MFPNVDIIIFCHLFLTYNFFTFITGTKVDPTPKYYFLD